MNKLSFRTQNSFSYFKVIDCEISNSVDNFGETCKLKISSFGTKFDGEFLYFKNDKYTIKSEINIDLYIDTVMIRSFLGFVYDIHYNNEFVEIIIKDQRFKDLYFTNRLKNSFNSGKLNDLIISIFDKYEVTKDYDYDYYISHWIKIIDMYVDKFTIDGYVNAIELLDKIKERFGLYLYSVHHNNPVIFMGYKYWKPFITRFEDIDDKKNPFNTHYFKFPNVSLNKYRKIIDLDLKYKVINKSDYLVKGNSVYTHLNENNTVTSVNNSYSYPENVENALNTITFSSPNLDMISLKNIVLQKYNMISFGGFEGTITTFGYPIIRIGDVIDLEINTSHINGEVELLHESYFIDEVITTFGSNGYKQKLKLGNKI